MKIGAGRICSLFRDFGDSKVSEFDNWIAMAVLAEHHIGRFDVTMGDWGAQAVKMGHRARNLKLAIWSKKVHYLWMFALFLHSVTAQNCQPKQ